MENKGTIVKQISNLYTVETNTGIYDCRARGKFYHDKITPLVGDKVIINEEEKYILEVLKRKNHLKRPSIANVDSCIIIVSVKEPNLDLNLLDRLLIIVIHNHITPVVVLTKLDLLKSREKINEIINYYNSIGIKTITNENLDQLEELIKNQTVVLTGQTGAGKSTLLNKLDENLNLKTSPISKALGRGVHTTRHVELFKHNTSLIADTPGFSSLDLTNLTNEEIRDTYPEFNVNCEFRDCAHIKEANCEVKKLVKEKKIMQSRYDNYLKFVR